MITSIKVLRHEGRDKIPIEDLTELSLVGEGVFDQLLQLQRIHLNREYKDARITGKEYSEVYLKTYIATLEQAIQFLLAKEKQAYELDLLAEQANKLRKEQDLLDVKIDQEKFILNIKMPKEIEMMDAQIAKLKADTRLVEEQILIAKEEIKLKKKDLILKDKEIALREKDLILRDKEIALKEKELLMRDKELDMMDKQLRLKEKEIALAQKEIELKEAMIAVKWKELEIAEAQLVLTYAKAKTEQAMTDGSLIGPGSVLGKKNAVLDAQILSMDRDADQKTAQLLLQTWITRMNNDAAYAYEANMLQDRFIGRAVANMFQGVGISTGGFDENAAPPAPNP